MGLRYFRKWVYFDWWNGCVDWYWYVMWWYISRIYVSILCVYVWICGLEFSLSSWVLFGCWEKRRKSKNRVIIWNWLDLLIRLLVNIQIGSLSGFWVLGFFWKLGLIWLVKWVGRLVMIYIRLLSCFDGISRLDVYMSVHIICLCMQTWSRVYFICSLGAEKTKENQRPG